MIYPILYDSHERLFESNGIGVLSDSISCKVREERNGPFELEMVYPVDGARYSRIQDRSIILARPNPFDRPQPFRVYSSSKPINGIVTFYAAHVSYDLNGIPVSPFFASSAISAMAALKENAVIECPFDFWTDKTTEAQMYVTVPNSIRSLLAGQQGSLLDAFGGGDYEFDHFKVNLYANRGEDRGVSIRYGKNLIDLKQERNCNNVYTGVYPYWTNADGDLVQIPEKIVHAEGSYDFSRILTLDFSLEFEDTPTYDQLRSRAKRYMSENNVGVPKVSLSVSHLMLENTAEYKGKAFLEQIRLCDTVSIEFPKLGVSAKTRAVKTVFDVLTNRYESIEFGETQTNLSDTTAAQALEIQSVADSSKTLIGAASAKLEDLMRDLSGMYSTTGAGQAILHDKKTLSASKVYLRISKNAVDVSVDGGNSYVAGFSMDGIEENILEALGMSKENSTVNLAFDLDVKGKVAANSAEFYDNVKVGETDLAECVWRKIIDASGNELTVLTKEE